MKAPQILNGTVTTNKNPSGICHDSCRINLQNLRKPAGRGDGHALAAALEEGLEALSILLNQSRGEAKRHL